MKTMVHFEISSHLGLCRPPVPGPARDSGSAVNVTFGSGDVAGQRYKQAGMVALDPGRPR